ncbi:hypothetical protein [Clostridium cochlearium]|uniref:DUF7922 domain-containing protein n=1 Tax=Clostridium cochlearium TaxID=1494 RepID=UPI0031402EC1
MAQKKNYSRYFIILQEDEKGYALASDKLPTGYVKLELKNDKCKVSYYVQNLKKEDAPYYMVLVLGKKGTNKLIRIGELNIDDYGRADVSYEYGSNNIANTQLSIDNISGAVVAKILDKNIIPVLSGFLTTDNLKWREFELLEARVNKDETKPEEKKEIKQINEPEKEINVFDKYEKQIEDTKEKNIKKQNTKNKSQEKETEIFEEVEKENTKVEDNKKEIKTGDEPRKDYSQEVIEKTCENAKEESKELDNEGNKIFVADTRSNCDEYPIGETGTFFRGIAEGFRDISDTIVDIKRCKWYRVPVNSIMDMYYIGDYNKYTTFYYPMINYYRYIEPYNHFIVGYKFNNEGKMKYLIYGIPGTKKLKHQPFRGKTGFVTWVPSKSKENEVNGYWLMFYDFKNSTILIPSKK